MIYIYIYIYIYVHTHTNTQTQTHIYIAGTVMCTITSKEHRYIKRNPNNRYITLCTLLVVVFDHGDKSCIQTGNIKKKKEVKISFLHPNHINT